MKKEIMHAQPPVSEGCGQNRLSHSGCFEKYEVTCEEASKSPRDVAKLHRRVPDLVLPPVLTYRKDWSTLHSLLGTCLWRERRLKERKRPPEQLTDVGGSTRHPDTDKWPKCAGTESSQTSLSHAQWLHWPPTARPNKSSFCPHFPNTHKCKVNSWIKAFNVLCTVLFEKIRSDIWEEESIWLGWAQDASDKL